MIKDRNELEKRKIEIDLSGPNGNAFVILGIASELCKQLNKQLGVTIKDWDKIQTEMTSGDYDHLIEVFEREFGDYVTIYK